MIAEPRLLKKIREPLLVIIHGSSAIALVYECVLSCLSCFTQDEIVMRVCIEKVGSMLQATDANIKYLGFSALEIISKVCPYHLDLFTSAIVETLNHEDSALRLKSMDLISFLINDETFEKIIHQLLSIGDHGDRQEVALRVLSLCRMDEYRHIKENNWYVQLLFGLCEHKG